MTVHPRLTRTMSGTMAILAALLIMSLAAGSVVAQDDGDAAQTREREQIRDMAQDGQGDAVRERIRERIENEDGLQAQEREQLRQHLGECNQLGLGDEVVAALFDETEPLRKQIRTQEQVLAMAREGLPVEPVTRKLQEGRRKGVNEQARERACDQMEAHVRAANRFMKQAREDGVTPGNPEAERERTREMARHMWRGLQEDDMEGLRERARLRLRDGSCTTEDLAAAAETGVKLKEMGVERKRAMNVAGEALQNGYTAREMHELGWMVMTAHMHGGPHDQVLDTLERGIRNQHQLSEMAQQMWQHGWMGPADEHGGRGGHNPIDDATGGGPGGHGSGHGEGDGDDGHHGGSNDNSDGGHGKK